MQVTETKSEGLSREFHIVVPADDIEGRMASRLKDLARTARLPGFRPGKVPLTLLRKRFGQSLLGEVLEEAVNSAAQQTMTERELRPVTQPKIEIQKFEDGADLEYTMAVELMPDILPLDLGGMTLERLIVEPADEEIQRSLDAIAKANGTAELVTEERDAKTGDIVVIDFVGRVDDEEFPGGKAEDYHLELGSASFIPGFEEQLSGAKAGDERTVEVAFPEDYGASNLAGKTASFAVSVKELRESKAAAVDDELAKKLGLEAVDDLRRTVREDHERRYRSIARMRLKRQLLDKLADAHSFGTPPGLVSAEFDAIWQQVEERRAAVERGEPPAEDDDPEDADKTDDELKAEYREIAERRVRLGLVLAEIGRINEVQVNEDDLNRAMTTEARKYPGSEREVFQKLKDSPEAQDALRAPVFEEKVVDFIIEMATVEDRRISSDQLTEVLAEDEGDADKADAAAGKSKSDSTAKDADDAG